MNSRINPITWLVLIKMVLLIFISLWGYQWGTTIQTEWIMYAIMNTFIVTGIIGVAGIVGVGISICVQLELD